MSAGKGRLPALFIAHGGGPWPFMETGGTWNGLERYLRGLDAELGRRPKAVLVISGHWEEANPTVQNGTRPAMIFDYFGFPEETYRLSYPAPGAPEVAERVGDLLEAAGIAHGQDPERGFDHGVFIPFMLIYPEADVPLVMLSLRKDLDPAAHLAIGRALAPLRDEDVLIVGSGMSYHNLRGFFSEDPQATAASESFDDWLTAALANPEPAARNRALEAWAEAPDAKACHPREEHLLPLMVVAGAAGENPGRRVFHDHVFGKALSGFQFG